MKKRTVVPIARGWQGVPRLALSSTFDAPLRLYGLDESATRFGEDQYAGHVVAHQRNHRSTAGRGIRILVGSDQSPEWAAGLSGSIELIDGQWVAQSPMGRVVVTFAPLNDYGVLDHSVALVNGQVFYNPMRVIADDEGSEVVFTLRRRPGMSDEDFARDADAVRQDLARLRQLLARR